MKNNGSVDWPQLIKKLSEPFPVSAIRWRPGKTSEDKRTARALPYVESRLYEARLDQLLAGQWMVSFRPWGDKRLICDLTIYGVTRSSTGEEGSSPADIAGTAAEAQAFKRACSKFTLGRYLYDLPTPWVGYDKKSKRLLETPVLKEVPGNRDGQLKVGSPSSEPTLSRARARKMHTMLTNMGFVKYDEHYLLAEKVAGREIKSLTALTEDEAREIWNEARREVQRRQRAARRDTKTSNHSRGRAA